MMCVVAGPMPAFAAEGGGVSESSFQTILIVLLIIAGAFAVTHVLAEWLSRRFGIVTGVEYIVVGAIIGPGLGLLTAERMTQVSPLLVLGEGSIGLLAGILLDFRSRDSITGRSIGLGAFVTLGTMLTVAVPPILLLAYFLPSVDTFTYVPHILCTTAVACVASQAGVPSRLLVGSHHLV